MNVTLRQLEAFRTVARLGSFAKAAATLHVTASALSNIIRKLEEAVDLTLFERTTRVVRLSPAGEQYLLAAEQILAAAMEAELCVANLRHQHETTVRVAATQIISWGMLPHLVSEFYKTHGGIRIVLQDVAIGAIEPLLHGANADIGLMPDYHISERLGKKPLLETQILLACSSSHPFFERTSVSWKELGSETVISTGITSILARAQLRDTPFKTFIEPKFATSGLGLVRTGLGVAIMPGYIVWARQEGNIRLIPITDPLINNSVVACWAHSRPLAPAAAAFLEFTANYPLAEGYRHALSHGNLASRQS